MAVWLVRAGQGGEREDYALDKGVATIGWSDVGDLTNILSRADLLARMQAVYPDQKPNTIKNWASQVWPFVKDIEVGVMVAMPLKRRPAVAFGKVTGPYRYDSEAPHDARNQIPVKWFAEIPRQAIPQDILYSLGAFLTVCRIWRNDAEPRLCSILEGKPASVNVAAPTDSGEDQPEDESVDLEEFTREQIRKAIYGLYKGHGLQDLVAAVLEAQGYKTQVRPVGPDGGVDVVAGSGPMGFDSPRMVVQVKSEQSPIDVKAVRELHGVMKDFGADHALFVAWGGFRGTVSKENARKFFEVRLWTSDDLVQAVLDHYDRLPDGVRATLPLKRIWMLVPETES